MRKINIFLLVMWIFIGICGVIVCMIGIEPSWLNFWICYTVIIVYLIQNII